MIFNASSSITVDYVYICIWYYVQHVLISNCITLLVGFVHRDIKLSNICFPLEQNSGLCLTIKQLFESKTDFVRIKLTDFGMAGMCFVSDNCHNSLL